VVLAHNGYLQVYLNLGLIGDLLLANYLIATYLLLFRKSKSSAGIASLSLGVWTALLFYNMSEAAFLGGLLWLVLLLGTLSYPGRVMAQVAAPSESEMRGITEFTRGGVWRSDLPKGP
jgi:O-antigen ligase